MTVRELMAAAWCCDLIEVVVRKGGSGKWIRGYRVGENAKIYPSELTAEIREARGLKEYTNPEISLKEGEEVDLFHIGSQDLPMRVICKDCHKLPDYIGDLVVHYVQPRHIPSYHKEQLTHNEYALDIWCYEDNYIPIVEIRETKQADLPGQVCIEDYIGETADPDQQFWIRPREVKDGSDKRNSVALYEVSE